MCFKVSFSTDRLQPQAKARRIDTWHAQNWQISGTDVENININVDFYIISLILSTSSFEHVSRDFFLKTQIIVIFIEYLQKKLLTYIHLILLYKPNTLTCVKISLIPSQLVISRKCAWDSCSNHSMSYLTCSNRSADLLLVTGLPDYQDHFNSETCYHFQWTNVV